MALIEDDIRTSDPEKKMLKHLYKSCGDVSPFDTQDKLLMSQMVERMNLRRNIGGRIFFFLHTVYIHGVVGKKCGIYSGWYDTKWNSDKSDGRHLAHPQLDENW